MGQLEYDNSAFYYFMISMLSLYLVPGWYFTAKYVISAFIYSEESHRSELEKKKQEKIKSNRRGMDKLKSRTFLANVLALVAFSLLFVYLVFQVMGDSSIASFDPYALLGIDRSATDRQIKKAYKLKALEFHPDKNVGDERAAQMFMMIAKAYEALTDDEAKENWLKYGNPDGKQSFEMSIGLPTFLMEKDNHNLILVGYLILMVVIVPTVVWAYYRQSQMYGEGDIMYRTYQTYANLLLGNGRPPIAKLKTLPEIFVTAAEFESLFPSSNMDKEIITAYHNTFKDMSDKAGKKGGSKDDSGVYLNVQKPSKWLEGARQNNPAIYWRIVKGNIALHAHMGRHQLLEHAKTTNQPVLTLPADWSTALDTMLMNSIGLVNALVTILSDSKRFESTVEAMIFSQCLTQGVWARGGVKKEMAPFLQLPHVTISDAVHMMGKGKDAKTFKDFLRHKFTIYAQECRKTEPNLIDEDIWKMWDNMDKSKKAMLDFDPLYERKGMKDLSDNSRSDLENVISILPDLDINIRHFVHDEDFTCERDTVTLELKLERRHVMEGNKAPPVHAPFFPSKAKEEYWVILRADDTRFSPWEMIMTKVTDQSKSVTTEMKFPAPPKAGKYKFTVYVISTCYLGIDHEHKFDLQVESAAELPEITDAYAKDDLEAEQALEATFGASNVDSDVSSDEEEETASSKAAMTKKAVAGTTVAAAAAAGSGNSGKSEKEKQEILTQKKKKEKRLALKHKKKSNEKTNVVIEEAQDSDSGSEEAGSSEEDSN
jgi:translocation protein SEC63